MALIISRRSFYCPKFATAPSSLASCPYCCSISYFLVEIATFEWVSWRNETRLHQSLGYRTPAEVETEFWKQNPPQAIIEIKAKA